MARQPNPAHRGLALAAVGLATFMTSLDNTVVNVALPSIQRDLGLSLPGLEWIASAYVLAFAGLLLAGGRLADLYGRRRQPATWCLHQLGTRKPGRAPSAFRPRPDPPRAGPASNPTPRKRTRAGEAT